MLYPPNYSILFPDSETDSISFPKNIKINALKIKIITGLRGVNKCS